MTEVVPECPRCRSTNLTRVGRTAAVTVYSCGDCKAAVVIPNPTPIQYERDDARHRALITITGPFNAPEVRVCLEQHRAEGAWAYGVLYDVRRMTSERSRETPVEFAALIKPRPGEPLSAILGAAVTK
jgi:DNA-directed RNA polymerase subunit RPC12/RpoP